MFHTKFRRWRGLAVALSVVASGLATAAVATAQQASGIAGLVRDSAGLAMPGVTVEASSPALIEKVRTVITDGEGRYTLVDLRPGAYVVTFSLPGFSTVRREGIQLGTGFTANVSVTMSVGALEETITVSGAAPVVDTASTRQQQTLDTSQLEKLPSGAIGLQTLAYVTPGFATTQSDVGGTRDTWSAQGAYTNYHGKTGTRASFDGFRNQYFIGAASGVGYVTDSGTIEEIQLEVTGMGAESGSGSTSLNAIPKSGSNIFRGGLDFYFSNDKMQGTNIDDYLSSFGLTAGKVQRIYRLGAQLGGPIKKDKLWFFGAVARWGQRVNQPGAFFNALQGTGQTVVGGPVILPGTTIGYSPDASRPAASFDWYRNHSARLTYQATERNKFNFFGDIQKSCRCTTGPFTGANAIESERGWDWWPSGIVQGTWTNPVTNRLLLEAGGSWHVANWVNFAEPGVTRDDRSILETATNFRYGATTLLTAPKARTGRSSEKFVVSYVTGTHNVKGGVTLEQAFNDESRDRNNSTDGLNYDFFNGVPIRLQYYALPFYQQERMNYELGLFVQDAWTIGRLTANLGIRMDRVNMGYPDAELPAGPFVPARQVTALSGVPLWTDVNPRIGAAYDLFGTGRTAIKTSLGRYNQLTRSDLTRRFHPFNSSVNAAFRNWDDANRNYVPDCQLANFAANGECGAISNTNFGKFIPTSTIFDDSVIKDNRDFLWDFLVEVQHEVVQGLSVSAGYNRNWDGAFQVTENTLVGPADFDEYCVRAPTDARLPGGGGNEICGLYDVKPSLFGRQQLRVTNSAEFGKQQRYWNGFVFNANGRLPKNITVGGGLDIGRQVDDHCYTVDVPNQPSGLDGPLRGGAQTQVANNVSPFCRVVTDWSNLMDLRVRGAIPLPKGFNASFIYRNTPGAPIDATLAVAANSPNIRFVNAARTTLNTAQTVTLYAPNSQFTDRFNQLDLAFSKSVRMDWARFNLSLDLYNALNSNSLQGVINAYGARWQRPTSFLEARLIRLTGKFDF